MDVRDGYAKRHSRRKKVIRYRSSTFSTWRTLEDINVAAIASASYAPSIYLTTSAQSRALVYSSISVTHDSPKQCIRANITLPNPSFLTSVLKLSRAFSRTACTWMVPDMRGAWIYLKILCKRYTLTFSMWYNQNEFFGLTFTSYQGAAYRACLGALLFGTIHMAAWNFCFCPL
jgi:hypothetical protein